MLTTIDYVLLGVLVLSALLGALRGLVAEVLSLVAWIGAFWLAFAYGADVAKLFETGSFAMQVHDPAARLFIAYALVFVAAVVAGGMVTWVVSKLVRSIGLGGVDRLFGLLFGAMRGIALGCVLVLVLGFSSFPQKGAWRVSLLIPEFQRGAEWMKAWLPEAVAEHVVYAPTRPVPAHKK